MAYVVRRTDGTALAAVADQALDTNTISLSLVGRGALNYGQSVAENFVRLLENFANTSPPSNALTGQLWFDTLADKLKYFDGKSWVVVGTGAGSGGWLNGGAQLGGAGGVAIATTLGTVTVACLLSNGHVVAVASHVDLPVASLPPTVAIDGQPYPFASRFPYGLEAGLTLAIDPAGYVLSGTATSAFYADTATGSGSGVSVGTGGGNGGTVTEILTGTGLTGGPIRTSGSIGLATTPVAPGTYSNPTITVDAYGRILSAASGAAVLPPTAPATPSNTAPANASTGVTLPVTLACATFAVGSGSDSHARSQWQVATDAAFASIVHDSGETTALTRYTAAALAASTTYYFRVRHQGLASGWSAYSAPTSFTTAVASGRQEFVSKTGLADLFTVPSGVTRIRVRATGGGGSAYNTYELWSAPHNPQYESIFGGGGGGGGTVEAVLPVTPGQSFQVSLGPQVRNVAGAAFGDAPGFAGPSASFGTAITAYGGGPAGRESGGVGGGGVGGAVATGQNGRAVVKGSSVYPYGGDGGKPGAWSDGTIPTSTNGPRVGEGGSSLSIVEYYEGINIGATSAPLVVVEWGPGI